MDHKQTTYMHCMQQLVAALRPSDYLAICIYLTPITSCVSHNFAK